MDDIDLQGDIIETELNREVTVKGENGENSNFMDNYEIGGEGGLLFKEGNSNFTLTFIRLKAKESPPGGKILGGPFTYILL